MSGFSEIKRSIKVQLTKIKKQYKQCGYQQNSNV